MPGRPFTNSGDLAMRLKIAVMLCVSVTALCAGNVLGAEASAAAGSGSAAKGGAPAPHFKKSAGQGISVARGHDVYVEQCAVCHGMHGKGDGPRSAFFQPGGQFIPDLTVGEYLKGRDDQLLQNIREGLKRQEEPAIVMPQFKYILSEDEIRSTLAYVKTLAAPAGKAIPVAAGATTAAAAKTDAGGSRAEVAMTKAGCMACHGKDKKIVGPSFREIAGKYKGQDATAKLMEKVRKGGSGVFGTIPMAPNPPDRISDADLKAAIEFILK